MGSEDAERVRLLHVDDHADVVTPLSSRLEAFGEFRVTLERDADAARATLAEEPFDCVLLAETVATTSAAEFCRQVRADGQDVPILVLAETPAAAVDAGVLAAGATDVVDASSEALLELLGQRIGLVVDRDEGAAAHSSRHRLLAGLPLGVFAGDETVTYASPALQELAGEKLRIGASSLAEALGVPPRAIDPEQPDPMIVRTERDETTGAREGANGAGDEIERPREEPSELALWTASIAGASDTSTVGAVWDLAAGSGTLAEWKERSDMLDSLLASLPLAVVFRDEDGRYVAASDHLTRLGPGRALTAPDGTVHHTPADVLGKTDHDLYPTALAEAVVEEHRQVLDAEQPATDWSGRGYSLQDETVALATTTAPWYDAEGTVVGTVSVWTDVSDRLASTREASVQREVVDVVANEFLEELEAGVRQLATATGTNGEGRGSAGDAGTFGGEPARDAVGSVSASDAAEGESASDAVDDESIGDATDRESSDDAADGRSGDAANGGPTDAADREPADRPAAASPASLAEQVAHLDDVVDDLATVVDVAHLDPTAVEPTELDVVASEAWEAVDERTDADCSLAVETEAVIQADPDGLRQFLAAVLQNAVESGADEIRVGTRELGFFVADDGPGVPPGERERVLDYGYSARSGAVGAGLTVADLVASAHQWTLSVADSADGGTRIEVDEVRFL